MSVKTVPTTHTDEGLRVQVAAPHYAVAVFRAPGDTVIEQESRVALPSAKKHYVLGLTGALFSKRDVTVKTHGNGTLKQYKYTSASEAAESLKSVGSFGSDFAKARNQINPPDEELDPNQPLVDELKAYMLRANAKAASQGIALPYPTVLN